MSITHGASCSSETLSSLPKAMPRSQGHFRMSNYLFHVCFGCLNYVLASSPRVLAPQNHTGNLWVPATSGTVSRPRRHLDFLVPLAPPTVSKSRGRSDQSAPDMNVCRAFTFYLRGCEY